MKSKARYRGTSKFQEWLKTVQEPSVRLYNIIVKICEEDDVSPDEITRERFLSHKGAGTMCWGELVSLKTGIDHKLLYNYKRTSPEYPEIQTGRQWEVNGEIYELFDMRVTAATSPTDFITTAFFRSQNPSSLNPIFEEKVKTILMEPDTFKPYFVNLQEPKITREPTKRIAYTIGKSNKVRWFDISEILSDFRVSKDGKNHIEFYYPFRACFSRFISAKIKGINPLTPGHYSTLEEQLKSSIRKHKSNIA